MANYTIVQNKRSLLEGLDKHEIETIIGLVYTLEAVHDHWENYTILSRSRSLKRISNAPSQ